MAREVQDIRPGVINAGVATKLDEFGHFRHLVRSLYATNLVPATMQGLV
jgi:HepT-like protein